MHTGYIQENSVLIALGANVPGPAGSPEMSLKTAASALPGLGIEVIHCADFLVTKAVPKGSGPDFCNGILLGKTKLLPVAILARLHALEKKLGRTREMAWAPRPIDLDLLSVSDVVSDGYWMAAARGNQPAQSEVGPIVPHPRMHLRRFVLEPLCSIAPKWRHPALGMTAEALLDRLSHTEQTH